MLRIPTTILGRDLVISVRLIVRPRFYLTGGGSLPSVLQGLESEEEGGVYEIQVYVERRSGCACGSLWHVAVARFGPIRFRSANDFVRSEEHTSELQSLMRRSYTVFCLKKKKETQTV